MSQLVITETMRAILFHMGSHASQSASIVDLDRVLRGAPIGKAPRGYQAMMEEGLWKSEGKYGRRVLTIKGVVVAANIIELTRDRGK